MQDDSAGPGLPPSTEPTVSHSPRDHEHERVGPYKILEKLGEGGMGIVYLAEQEAPLRRRVALKVIKPGMDSRQVLARFEAERQALALMNHQGVAKVFDAGVTAEGRPYFVMEHVAGIPINEYCDANLLSNRERLELFIQVCEAIQHAHQKGIIHRDIKPSNVLVAVSEGTPTPKVIDFGVAKAIQQRLTEQTFFTEHGVLIGTPAYMSPEQAEVNALDIDTRSDVFSLGVLLYELVVGALPLDPVALRKAAFHEMQRIIRETDPPKPSLRLGTLGGVADETARRRRTNVRSLYRQLTGELDWIAMKSIEKDRTRRYPTAIDLAADVRRYLAGEPVLARRTGPAYRARKFVRRHRLAFGASLAVLIALAAGLVATSIQYIQAARATQEARRIAYRLAIPLAATSLRDGQIQEAKLNLYGVQASEFRGWEWGHVLFRISSGARALAEPKNFRGCDHVGFSSDGGEAVCLGWASDPVAYLRVPALLNQPWNDELDAAALLDTPIPAGSTPSDRMERTWTKVLLFNSEQSLALLQENKLRARTESITTWDATSVDLVSVPSLRKTWTAEFGHAQAAAMLNSGALLVVARGGEQSDPRQKAYRLAILDAASGRLLREMPSAAGTATMVLVSADGRWVVVCTEDGFIDVWRLDSGTRRRIPSLGPSRLRSLDIDAEGTLIAASAGDGFVTLVDPAHGAVIRRWQAASEGGIVALHPSGRLVAIGSPDGSVSTWSTEDGHLMSVRRGVEGIQAIRFSGDGARFAIAGTRGTRVLDTFADGFGRTLRARRDVMAISFAPGGEELLAIGRRSEAFAAERFDLGAPPSEEGQSTGRPRGGGSVRHREDPPSPDEAIPVAFFANGDRFVDCVQGNESLDPGIRIREARTGRILQTLEPVDDVLTRFAISGDGRWVAGASSAGPLHVWNLADGTHQALLRDVKGPLGPLAFDSTGKLLAAGAGQRVLVVDVGSGKLIREVETFSGQADLSPQRVWDLHYLSSLVFSPDGKWIVAASVDRDRALNIGRYAIDSASSQARFNLTKAPVVAMALSPDGRRLAIGSIEPVIGRGGELRILEFPSLEPLLMLDEFTNRESVIALAFSPDGRKLASAHLGGRIRVFDSRPWN